MPSEDNVMDLESFETTLAEEKAADEAAKNKKEEPTGTELPDVLKGKSTEEVAGSVAGLEDGFRKSEAERQRLQGALEASSRQPESARREPEPTAELSDAELQRMHDENPVAALKAVAKSTETRVTERLHKERVEPLLNQIGSLAATQEVLARDRHKALFERYGDEMREEAKKMRPEALAHPGVWDDLARFVTGKHFDEMLEAEVAKRTGKKKEEEVENAGHSASPTPRQRPREGAAQLDPLQKEVMQKMGIFKDDAEYLRWSKGDRKMEISEVPQ